ncbi:hypothetical protein K437DRAFT_272812 [Tilletiaria anomala UBC 951]|uniref:RecA family profile 1 domain-containing protein n=1 Tax=Tilletiaria anomala (strain ATCC 24038 / CBS 436.72 / UBC 951) TaxID=1037660 RepID=A0A066WDU0_TILAU|nr:uncharacterized protein K437DRAFT_272812 [Tilletiaria anomala UBC 951]KDN52122.1 hypothetical protein K437DRAFT_272812 [Tilletiaria anomala UBC 951]
MSTMDRGPPGLPGLASEDSLLCHKAGLLTPLDLLLASPIDVEKQIGAGGNNSPVTSSIMITANDVVRMQHVVQLAVHPRSSPSLWQEVRQAHRSRERNVVDFVTGWTQFKATGPALSLSQIVAATPGQDEVSLTLFDYSSLPPGAYPTCSLASTSADAFLAEPTTGRQTCKKNAQAVGCRSAEASGSRFFSEGVVPTGVKSLDTMLNGGLRRGTITDLAGESGSGKTQLIIQTIMSTLLGIKMVDALDSIDLFADDPQRIPPLGDRRSPEPPHWEAAGGVALLLTGGKAAAHKVVNRLVEMVQTRYASRTQERHPRQEQHLSFSQPTSSGIFKGSGRKRSHKSMQTDTEEASPASRSGAESCVHIRRMLQNLHIAHAPNFEALHRILHHTLPSFQDTLSLSSTRGARHANQNSAPLDLIVIDNLATVLNEVHGNNVEGMMQRSRMLCDLSEQLKYVAAGSSVDSLDEHRPHLGSAVLVVNHLADALESTRLFSERCNKLRDSTTFSLLADPASDLSSDAPSNFVEPDDLHAPPDFELQAAHSSGLITSLCKLDYASTGGSGGGAVDTFSIPAEANSNVASGKVAQLGPVWTSCVNARVLLNKTRQRIALPLSLSAADSAGCFTPSTGQTVRQKHPNNSQLVCVRQAAVSFSSWCASGLELDEPAHFVITQKGLITVPPDSIQCSPAITVARDPISQGTAKAKTDPRQEVSPSEDELGFYGSEHWIDGSTLTEEDLLQAAQEAEEEAMLSGVVAQGAI